MSAAENGHVEGLEGGGVDLAGRLRLRRGEIEEAIFAGVRDGVPGQALDYELDAWHVCAIAQGSRAQEAVRVVVAAAPGCQLLTVSRGEETVWAWLGGQHKLAVADLERRLPNRLQAGVSLAVGEPGRGLEGWRLTHRQAQAALLVALRRPGTLTRYAGNMLVAAALGDEMLARSLREIYLVPLAGQRDRGAVLRETLRAYFAAERNMATAAHGLRVNRHTVERRLRTIETLLGRLLSTCQAELEVALLVEELEDAGAEAGARDVDGAEDGASPR
jgi:sugar diacid utilization regulator